MHRLPFYRCGTFRVTMTTRNSIAGNLLFPHSSEIPDAICLMG